MNCKYIKNRGFVPKIKIKMYSNGENTIMTMRYSLYFEAELIIIIANILLIISSLLILMITANNIKVAFVAFVFGIFFSAGTLWILFSNGVMLGAFQYFFFQHGLLLHSVMSVWAHGTFEITSIIIAGGAGLVMGNSFLFPGTYKRSHSFRNGALRGIKIVTGLIPFFIIAGWIESFITRYADTYPVVGAVAIILSLGGVIGYFVVYPYYLHKTETNGKD